MGFLSKIFKKNDSNKEEIKEVLENAGVDPSRRAETLDIAEFAAIANGVALCSRR